MSIHLSPNDLRGNQRDQILLEDYGLGGAKRTRGLLEKDEPLEGYGYAIVG
ncbi:MAG TPA: hypothetical protein VE955_05410 [Candidatus Dormibacteraeota bacterium]|nr:hypothetical protein [Candidatus Dormibacteraeota bacterium]